MAFTTTSTCGIKLTPAEEQMLEKVDNFAYTELNGYPSLGQLHRTLTVELRGSVPERSRKVTYKRRDVERRINELKRLIAEMESRLRTMREQERPDNDPFVQRLHKLKDILERLQSILYRMDRDKKDELEKEEKMQVFGEYIRQAPGVKPVVALYMQTIRSCRQSDWVLAETYVHEMHHAWYDSDNAKAPAYIMEVEEPLTELGMLLFMDKFDAVEPGIAGHALSSVKHKQWGYTSCYGFGAFLHEDATWKTQDWRKAMLDAKYGIDDPSPLLVAYQEPFLQGLYPTDEAAWADMLWRILHGDSAYLGGLQRLMTFDVAGLQHKDPTGEYRAHDLKRLKVGDTLELRPDFANSYDSNAILLIAPDGRELGYVPMAVNPISAAMLRRGEKLTAVISGIQNPPSYSNRHVLVDLYGPLTASARPLAAEDPDKLAVWDEFTFTPDPAEVAKLASKKKIELHALRGKYHRTIQIYEEDFLHNHLNVFRDAVDCSGDDYFYDISYHYCPVNYGGTFDPATSRVIGGKWAPRLRNDSSTFIYDDMYINPFGVFVAKLAGVTGVMFRAENFIPCSKPDMVCEIEDDVLITRDPSKDRNNKAIMDADGNILSDWYDCFLSPDDNGYMEVREYLPNGSSDGFIDSKPYKSGKFCPVVIPLIYETVYYFENGRAKVKTHAGEEFYIDEKGNRLPDPVEK